MATKLELAWSAGIIDGEGCIGISRKTNNIYTITIQISMTHQLTINRIYEIFRLGNLYFRKARNCKHNDQYQWNSAGKDLYNILKLIYPYLITKEEQAILAIEFYEKCMINSGLKEERGNNLNVETVDLMLGLYLDMKELNKRGNQKEII